MNLDRYPRLAVGNTSIVYGWALGQVIKVFDPDIPSHWAGLEAAWTQALHEAGAPVPEVHDLTEVGGRRAIVYERVTGATLLAALVQPGAEIVAIAEQMADLQAWLHTLTPPAGIPRLRDRLTTKIGEAVELDPTTRQRALTELSELADGEALCHGDLHPGNVIVTTSGPIVVDWFDVAVGNPAADVARTSLLIRPRPRSGPPPFLEGTSTELLERFHTAYLDRYHALLGGEADSWRRWQFVVAVARLCEPGRHDDLDELIGDDPAASTQGQPSGV